MEAATKTEAAAKTEAATKTGAVNGAAQANGAAENGAAENGDERHDAPGHGRFYSKAADYWENCEPTINGMLGGFGKISATDIEGSDKFLKALYKNPETAPASRARALDCGAGIGRISKHLLSKHFDAVDLAEQSGKFLEKAKAYLAATPQVDRMFCTGLQSFSPQHAAYDVIWCQWVLGHLTDEDLVKFFRRCVLGLRPSGVICVKENLTSSGEVESDEEDSSVTRPEELLREIFERAGCEVLREFKQNKFPDDLYTVKMFALRPRTGQ